MTDDNDAGDDNAGIAGTGLVTLIFSCDLSRTSWVSLA
jgi:hypothetical protein